MKNKYLAIAVLAILISACTARTPTPDLAMPTYAAPSVAATESTPVEQAALTPATSTLQPTQAFTLPAPTATSETAVPGTAASVTPTILSIPTATATQANLTIGPNQYPDGTDPLTGLAVNDPNLLNRRPVAVKIQLYPRGQRPVYGVSLADIVFDYYQNDGLTRLNAIFYGQDAQKIGPVRSARLFDESVIRMYKSLFAFGGAASYVLERLYNADFANRVITQRNKNCPPMCREDPNGFNFLFTNSSDLTTYAAKNGVDESRQNLNGMSFSSQVPADGQLGTQLFTRYSISAYVRWDYDPASGRYLRFQDDKEAYDIKSEVYKPFIDGLTKEQIAADNVVVLFLPHEPASNSSSMKAVDVRMEGSGDGIAFRDGQAYQVKWNRPDKNSVPFLTTNDGKPFPLKPGNTWYQLAGISSQTENPSAGIWRITSKNP